MWFKDSGYLLESISFAKSSCFRTEREDGLFSMDSVIASEIGPAILVAAQEKVPFSAICVEKSLPFATLASFVALITAVIEPRFIIYFDIPKHARKVPVNCIKPCNEPAPCLL